MPVYATQQDVLDAYGERFSVMVSDRDLDGVEDDASLTRALDDADGEIDAYVGAVYEIPLSTIPQSLRRVAVDIAVYRLANEHDVLTEEIRRRYEDARMLLRDIASRKASLGLPTASTPPSVGGGVVRTGPDRVFTRSKTGGLA